jgi:hypothetical protein
MHQVGDQTKVVALCCALLTQCYSSDDIKDIEMEGACGNYGGRIEIHTKFYGET